LILQPLGLRAIKKGGREQQGWKPAKSRFFLRRFGQSQRKSFLIEQYS